MYKVAWPNLIAIGGNARELCQLDLRPPVGAVPHEGDVTSTPLLIDVALVVRLSVLQSTAMRLSESEGQTDRQTAVMWVQLSVCCNKQRHRNQGGLVSITPGAQHMQVWGLSEVKRAVGRAWGATALI